MTSWAAPAPENPLLSTLAEPAESPGLLGLPQPSSSTIPEGLLASGTTAVTDLLANLGIGGQGQLPGLPSLPPSPPTSLTPSPPASPPPPPEPSEVRACAAAPALLVGVGRPVWPAAAAARGRADGSAVAHGAAAPRGDVSADWDAAP